MFIKLAVFYLNLYYIEAKGNGMEGFIVGGEDASIEMFPYSAHLSIRCSTWSSFDEFYECGASIISNDVCLTAGHCVHGCISYNIMISVGHSNKNKGFKTRHHNHLIHPKFNYNSTSHDIALVKSKQPFKFNAKISRLNLKPNPIYASGYLAGWGYINEEALISTNKLKYTKLPYVDRENCTRILGNIPVGTICAGKINGNSYAAEGDSGSALVVDNYQIGLVSYKVPGISNSLVVFTDVPFHYNWIRNKMRQI